MTANSPETGQDIRPQARALLGALAITALFLAVEVAGGLLAGSLALLADAGHMLGDAGALGLALFALWYGRRPATARRTYGHQRVEVLAALVNALTLLAVTGYILFEALGRFRDPPPVEAPPVLVIGALGLAANAAAGALLQRTAWESINVRGPSSTCLATCSAPSGCWPPALSSSPPGSRRRTR